MTRPPKPADMPWLIPYLTVQDVEASMKFYQKAFGFDLGESMPGPEGKVMHGSMNFKGQCILMMGPEGAYGNEAKTPTHSGVKSPTGLYVYCEDVDALFAQAKAGGAEVVLEPEDAFWGDRTACLKDPDGFIWTFATNVADFDPKNIPQS